MSEMINEQDVEDSSELDFELIVKENEEFRKIISQKDEMIQNACRIFKTFKHQDTQLGSCLCDNCTEIDNFIGCTQNH